MSPNKLNVVYRIVLRSKKAHFTRFHPPFRICVRSFSLLKDSFTLHDDNYAMRQVVCNVSENKQKAKNKTTNNDSCNKSIKSMDPVTMHSVIIDLNKNLIIFFDWKRYE